MKRQSGVTAIRVGCGSPENSTLCLCVKIIVFIFAMLNAVVYKNEVKFNKN